MAENTVIDSGGRAVLKDGGSFAAPPEHAPHEVSQPLSAALLADQQAKAAQNEQPLPPFKPKGGRPLVGPAIGPPGALPVPTVVPAAAKGRTLSSRRPAVAAEPQHLVTETAQTIADAVHAEQAAAALPSGDEPVTMPPDVADAPPELAPILPHMRAASNTDSPSRGIPPAILDPGKRITGGFGEPSEGQYFPLDGAELRAIVEGLLAELHARIQDDLRFSLALTYPRVRVHVDVVVEAYAADGGFTVQKYATPYERTPIEVAERFGEEVTFIVRGERREFDAEGQPDQAPNAMRAEAGLTIPRKQRIEAGHGIVYADR
jgi:hypothetical protein